MSKSRVYIGVGSNLGDREANLKKAAELLGKVVEVKALSPLYDTAPWGVADQPRFLNGAVEVFTHLSPLELLAELKSIEIRLGRVESEENRYGPRLIDLDIIFFGDEVIDLDELVVPHPSMHERAFVLKPLSDIAPDFIHPILKKSVSELLKSLPIMDVETEHS